MKLNYAMRGNEFQGLCKGNQFSLVIGATHRKTTVAFKDTPTYFDNSTPAAYAGGLTIVSGGAIWVD